MKKWIFFILATGLLILFSTQMSFNEVGLKALSWFKYISGNSVNLNKMNTSSSEYVSHDIWNELLVAYVSETGEVDYEGFISERDKFEKYLDNLSKNPPNKNDSKEFQLAYWINAYNAFTVKLIIDNYPLKSIKEISKGLVMINSPWDIQFFEIGEVSFDLNTIEHEILRKRFKEPRIHFAINCASFSCPKLLDRAYESEQLEEQLEDQTVAFINNPEKNIVLEKNMELSKIFTWFEMDFREQGGVRSFIQKRVTTNIENAAIHFIDYNWELNSMAPKL